MQTNENEDKLVEFDPNPVVTRTQLLPAWFMILNGFVLVSGLLAFALFCIMYSNLQERREYPLLAYLKVNDFRILIVEFIRILPLIPAFMFFIQRRPAATLGIVFGVLRLLVPFYNGPMHLINDFFYYIYMVRLDVSAPGLDGPRFPHPQAMENGPARPLT